MTTTAQLSGSCCQLGIIGACGKCGEQHSMSKETKSHVAGAWKACQASWDPVGRHPTTLSTTFWLENPCGRCMDNESQQGRLNAKDQLED